MEIKLYLGVLYGRRSKDRQESNRPNSRSCFHFIQSKEKKRKKKRKWLGKWQKMNPYDCNIFFWFLELTLFTLIDRFGYTYFKDKYTFTYNTSVVDRGWDIKDKIKMAILFILTTLIFSYLYMTVRSRVLQRDRDKFKTGRLVYRIFVVNRAFFEEKAAGTKTKSI